MALLESTQHIVNTVEYIFPNLPSSRPTFYEICLHSGFTIAVDSHSILVVDDDAHFRELLSSVLMSAGYKVLTAKNGNEVMALCNTDKPDLVLLDLVMPGLDGIETCKRLKAIPQTEDTPIIILTASNNTEVICCRRHRLYG